MPAGVGEGAGAVLGTVGSNPAAGGPVGSGAGAHAPIARMAQASEISQAAGTRDYDL
jgi:hypothetical protein